MDTNSLNNYLKKLQHLRVSRSRTKGEAPYKPALLLAVLEGIENGTIQNNQITITPELVAAFKSVCSLLSHSSLYTTNNFALPFYHLTGDGFWHLVAKPGMELVLTSSNSVKSFRSLQDTIDYAQLDAPLYALLQDRVNLEKCRQTILDRYFPITKHLYNSGSGQQLINDITHQILEEPPIQQFSAKTDELEVVIRSGLFKQEVLRQYNDTCAVTGLRIVSTTRISLMDACHIVPWAVSKDDTIGNGIALCPNLHRAFDRNLFWIDENYQVQIVPNRFTESGNTDFGIKQFHGKELHLPKNKCYWPSKSNLNSRIEAIPTLKN